MEGTEAVCGNGGGCGCAESVVFTPPRPLFREKADALNGTAFGRSGNFAPAPAYAEREPKGGWDVAI